MEGKERFGAKYEENSTRSDCRMRVQGMSDLFMHECVDIAWDDFFLDDDRTVPHHGSKRLNDRFTLGENNKRCRREIANISNNTGGSATKCIDLDRDESGISPLSKSRKTILEKDPWSYKLNGPITCASDNEPIKEESSLACDSAMPLSHGLKNNNRDVNSDELNKHTAVILNKKFSLVDDAPYHFPTGDGNPTGNNFFENADNKDPNDLLYYDWSEIENFDDIDRTFRSDSSLDLGICKENELSWLSSADDIGGSGDALSLDAKYTCSDPCKVKTISEKHDFSNGNSLNDFARSNAPPIRYEDCSRTSEKSDSFRSSLTGPDIEDSKEGFISPEQEIGFNSKLQPIFPISSHFRSGDASVNSEHKKKIKVQSPYRLENCSLTQIGDLQNEVINSRSGLTSNEVFASVHVQQQQHTPASYSDSCLEDPISNTHLKGSHWSDPSSVNLDQSIVKSETNELEPLSSRDSHHVSSHLQYMDGFSGPPFKLKHCQGNQDSLQNGTMVNQASSSDSGLVGRYENRCDAQGSSSANEAEIGSSNIQESSAMVPDLDDISQEAASFRQLQLFTKQLDWNTKICIRDSLYRLAQSAEQRRGNPNFNGGFEDERDASGGASEAEGTKRCAGFMDMETETNPIDRSVAHLLFHRPSNSSNTLARGSFDFQSPSVVRGSAASPAVLCDSLTSEENVSESIDMVAPLSAVCMVI